MGGDEVFSRQTVIFIRLDARRFMRAGVRSPIVEAPGRVELAKTKLAFEHGSWSRVAICSSQP